MSDEPTKVLRALWTADEATEAADRYMAQFRGIIRG